MSTHRSHSPTWAVLTVALLLTLLLGLLPAAVSQAAPVGAPLAEPNATTVELIAVEDQGMIESAPTFIAPFYPYFVINGRNSANQDWNFIQFDLSAIPANAVIDGAQLKVAVIGFGGPAREIEVGRADGDWEEGVTSWSTMPAVTWANQKQTITDVGEVTWPLKPLVEAWHNGTTVNNGVVVRGLDNGNGAGSQARTKDGACLDQDNNAVCDYDFDLPPRLIITYSEPAVEGARPDLGDAPDSDANHVGINNTAYLDGTLGHFPTVHSGTPANQGAGPRHNNVTLEAILGDTLTREGEADSGPDQDNGHNNILDGGNDNANRDRGDDGWRNRTATFDHCRRTTLTVRVRKAANAQRNTMYLNVWFDGNKDGDWQDQAPCPPEDGVPAPVANEWIVQDYIVVMNGIPAGGYLDIPVNTERVLNLAPDKLHWLRFSLSEVPAPSAPGQLPDGRGPHPSSPAGAYAFGETEDYIVKPRQTGENGPLKIQKTVINSSGGVVPIGGLVTYEITLKHDGGTQPIDALIRDELTAGMRLFPQIVNGQIEYVVATSPTGGATPLQAEYRTTISPTFPLPIYTVGWNGTLAPNAIVKLSFLVQNLGICPPNQNTLNVVNVARARARSSNEGVTDQATFTAACPGYSPLDIDFEEVPNENPIDLDDLNNEPWHGTVLNSHPFTVSLGLYQRPAANAVEASDVLTTSKPPGRLLDIVILKPGEKKPLDLLLRTGDESSALTSGDLSEISFCFLPAADGVCPPEQQYPNLHGHVPFTPTVRPSDLGDAPDSTNHFNQPMTAYPNVPANYPTVFDPAAGQPQGPRHFHPRAFHLGPRVSRELEADQGPDQDPLNNIVPPANDPDNDRFDDGSRLRNLNNCQPAAADVQVAIRPAALAYFQQLGTPAYLNVWLDGNRDGDWADGFTCQDAQGQNHAVVEHILIDYPINVVGLGAGLHNLANIATNRVPWLAQLANRPTWVRFTLSDQPSNKTLTFGNPDNPIKYGDGRGYAQPFKVGETEDHYRYYGGNDVDLAVQVVAEYQPTAGQQPGLQAAAIDKLGNFEIQLWKINVANIGTAGVSNALLEFQIPEHVRGQQPVILQAPGVATQSISFNFDKINMILPFIEQDNAFSVVLGWYGCITCTVANNVAAAGLAVDYTGSAKVTATGDSDSSNNQSSATLRGLLSSPIIGAFMDYTDDSCMDHIVTGHAVTNRTTVQLRGKAAPNQIIAILIGLVRVGTVTSDGNGDFIYTTNPGAGLLGIRAEYANQVQSAAAEIISPRDPASGQATGLRLLVNPDLPYDPMSVCFTDSQGKAIFVPFFGYSFGVTQTGGWLLDGSIGLTSGETYRMSVCGRGSSANSALDAGFTLSDDLLNEALAAKLKDPEGDGCYSGLVTLPKPTVQAAGMEAANATAKLTLNIANGSSETSVSSTISLASDGVISDRATGQPVAGAAVAVLLAQASDSGVTYVTPASGTLGQPNPTTSAANGAYSFNVPNGIYRLDVLANGYQPYRTGDIVVTDGRLAVNIALSPVVNEAASQRILISADGFSPAQVNIAPGSVVEFVNVDLADHTSTSAQWESGVLAAGGSYKVKLNSAGLFTFSDGADASSTGTITVGNIPVGGANKVYLAVVRK